MPIALLTTTSEGSKASAPIFRFVCSGYLANEHTVVTAAHCVRDLPSLVTAGGADNLCETTGWAESSARQVHVDPDADLAILRIDQPLIASGEHSFRSTSEFVAVGWQQPHRSAPVQCRLAAVPLSGCVISGSSGLCDIDNTSVICGGMSGGQVVAAGGTLGIISASDSCTAGQALIGVVPSGSVSIAWG